MSNTNGNNHLGVNLAFTKFLFVTVRRNDDSAHARVKAAGGILARSFFNEFDIDSARDPQPLETVQFLIADPTRENGEGLLSARYVAQLSTKYRPRLHEVEQELQRRVGGHAQIRSLDGAAQIPRYTSAELHAFAYKPAVPRSSGRIMRHAIILPITKTGEWWAKSALERHTYFYPHADLATGSTVPGHVRAAEAGIPTIFRRLYHNPDGYQREGQFDFITYFECADEHLETFDTVRRSLRSEGQNPECRFVVEGPEWRGIRVLRW